MPCRTPAPRAAPAPPQCIRPRIPAWWPVARALTNALNPFALFTALFALVALAEAGVVRGLLYLVVELVAAAAVAAYVLLMRRRSRVGDFWISTRVERL